MNPKKRDTFCYPYIDLTQDNGNLVPLKQQKPSKGCENIQKKNAR